MNQAAASSSPRIDADAALLSRLRRRLGEGIMRAFESDDITEIYMVEGSNQVWFDHRSRGRFKSDVQLSDAEVETILRGIASWTKSQLGPANPVLQAQLPESMGRVQGVIPPVSTQPVFVFRKPNPYLIALEDLVKQDFMPRAAIELLRSSIDQRRNIVVVGGTGTGKTTFLNSLLLEVSKRHPQDRIVILEDTRELECASRDKLSMQTSESLSLYQLLDITLRVSPDRVVVGEVRNEAALPLLDAWTTGHPGGLASVHASGTKAALTRLNNLVNRAGKGEQPDLVGEAVDLIVEVRGSNTKQRHIWEIARVGDHLGAKRYEIETLYQAHASARPGK